MCCVSAIPLGPVPQRLLQHLWPVRGTQWVLSRANDTQRVLSQGQPITIKQISPKTAHGQAFLCLPTVAQHCILGVVAGPELSFLTLDLSPPHAPLPQLPLPKPGLAQVLRQHPLPLNTDLALQPEAQLSA